MASYFYSNFVDLFGEATSLKVTPEPNTAFHTSPLTGQVTPIVRPGGRFRVEATWRNLDDDNRRELAALLTLLNGTEHYFHLSPLYLSGERVRGDWGGSPVVDGGSNTGMTLAVRGADTNVTGWAKAGDYFRLNSQLLMVTEEADSDGSGDVSLSVWPSMRGTPADGETLDANQQCRFRMISMSGFPYSVDTKIGTNQFASTITATFIDTGVAV